MKSLIQLPVPRKQRPHEDLALARVLASGSIVWTLDVCLQLANLVERNKRAGSPLGYDGYIAMRELLYQVRALLDVQEAASRALLAD